MADTVGKIKAVLGLSTKKFTQGLRTAQKKTRIFGKTAKRVGGIIAGALSFGAVIQGTRKTIKTFADFSYEMSRLEAISGATGSQLKTLEEQAKVLGGTTQRTASQVAGLQVELAKKGFSTDQIEAATDGIVRLSIASGEDLPQSAELAAGVMNAFGMEAKQMGRITDVMAKSFSESALDLNKFQLGMSKVAPVAKQAGMSIEETTAVLGTLVDSNVKASTASAQLRNILITVNKEGISFKQALDQLKGSTDQMGAATELFGKRASPIASILAQNQDKTEQLTKSFNNAEGAAKKMSDVMKDNLKGDLIAAGSALEALMIEAGQSENSGLRGIVKNITEKIRDMTDDIGDTIDTIKRWAKIIGRAVAGFVALKLAIGAYLTIAKAAQIATKVWTVAQKGLNLAMRANPIGIIVTAVTALATALYTAYQRSDKFRAAIITAFKKVSSFFRKIGAAAKALLEEGPAAAARAWRNVDSPDYKDILDKEKAKKEAKEAGYESVDAYEKALEQGKDIRKSTDALFGGMENSAKDKGEEVGKNAAQGVEEGYEKEMKKIDLTPDVSLITSEEAKEQADTGEKGYDISEGGIVPDNAGVNIEKTKDNLRDFSNMADRAFESFIHFGKAYDQLTPKQQSFIDQQMRMKQAVNSASKAIKAATVSMASTVLTSLGNMAAGGEMTMNKMLGGVLNTLAGLMEKVGKMAIGVGIAIEGIKKALQSLNPAVAIGAGVALLALAGAVRAAASSLAETGEAGEGSRKAVGMAEGGVVPSGFPNDSFPARLTSGEVVLNQKQLKNLGRQKGYIAETSIDMDEFRIGIKESERRQNNTL